ncbi:AAA family ATPase [Campylobacter sp. FMV-PI01]|uniref:AAA family ATPase n=1 Tax=Campylobacter portucalensis TaxID=2608384 RepID=A0A6L5WGL4_9BACT|nr:AAA family ATPase [Campylobacter portucalensis]MSN96310.1 AAA family ATPase [Campylobacter portucalensis]
MRLNLMQIMQKFKKNKLNFVLFFLVILIGLLSFVYFRNSASYISYEDYKRLLNLNAIEKAYIKNDKIYLTYNKKDYIVLKEAINLNELFKKVKISKVDENTFLIEFLLIFVLFVAFLSFLIFKRNGLKNSTTQIHKNLTKNTYTFTPAISDIKFSDVAGIDEVKSELCEIVDFLKNPKSYNKLGIKLPKGVIMVGPPGVGKTLIAKAVAGEAGVPFFYESGANFSEMFVGLGAKKVKELFANAASCAPSIIFIDEIDAVGKSRGNGRNDEREVTLNQLLTQMDGFEENSGVIVMAATNKIELLDDALLRPGRFDRRVYVSLPNYKDRIEILKIYLKNKKTNLNLSKLSRLTVGFSGAGLATFVNEAMMNVLKRGGDTLELSDFEIVKGKILNGKKKELVLSEEEKQIQALYQASKALSAYWFGLCFEKIHLLEEEFISDDREILSKSNLESKLKVYLSGFCALKIYKNDIFSNSKFDIQKAQNLAEKMVFEYAMNGKFMPNSNDILEILDKNYQEISDFLDTMEDVLFEISKVIFTFEIITYDEIRKIITKFYEKDEDAKD